MFTIEVRQGTRINKRAINLAFKFLKGGVHMFYLGAACIFFITLGVMYGEARYAQGRNDVVEELIEKYTKEERPS